MRAILSLRERARAKIRESLYLPVFLVLMSIVAVGCRGLQRSKGAAQTPFGARTVNPADVVVPSGYKVEVAATDLTFPTGVTLDENNVLYVVEAGYSYGEAWATPRLLRIQSEGRLYVTDNRYDDHGSRSLWGTPDLLWRVTPGMWYGWPDFSGNEPVYQGRFKPPGEPLSDSGKIVYNDDGRAVCGQVRPRRERAVALWQWQETSASSRIRTGCCESKSRAGSAAATRSFMRGTSAANPF